MKRKNLFVLMVMLVTLFAVFVPTAGAKEACIKINSGNLVRNGMTVKPGFDDLGYNYQAHRFFYTSSSEAATLRQRYTWNDAYLSNKSCDGDFELDEHDGFDSYVGSGAWKTLQWKRNYIDADGKSCTWEISKKIIAIPEGAYLESGIYYTADGTEIGKRTSEHFALVEDESSLICR